MFKQALYSVVSFLIGSRLRPVSVQEEESLAELAVAFRDLPIVESSGQTPSQAAWAANMNRLRELVLHDNPRRFLRWDVIRTTMFVAFANYIYRELRYLKAEPDWNARWRNAVEESSVGHPIPYVFFRKSSGNLIHHAYHLAQFERKIGVKVGEVSLVMEFGGGYGSMCRLAHRLGFRGRYIIYDLPPFSLIQRYYLKTLGLPVMELDEFSTSKDGIFLVTDIRDLQILLGGVRGLAGKMFLGTWSISETPLELRGPLLSLVEDFSYYLIGYQSRFEEVDNEKFFSNWIADKHDIVWHRFAIQHLQGSYYLFGKSNQVL